MTTDGVNEVLQTVTGITIDTVCGASSTVISEPELAFLSKAPNTLPPLNINGKFESSNSNCPITEIIMVSGQKNFELTVTDETEFSLAMSEAANKVETDFTYSIRATALGQATTTVNGEMQITKTCLA